MLGQVFLNIGYRGDEHQIPAKYSTCIWKKISNWGSNLR